MIHSNVHTRKHKVETHSPGNETRCAPLQVKNLTKRYHVNKNQTFEAVSNISFEVKSGECFGLLGPNGAGKSTTIQCISGFYPATEGQILIHGYNVYQNPKQARKLLGVCPQEDTLDTDFSIENQLIRHATFFKIPIEEGTKRAQALLKRMGLSDKAKQNTDSLSGGMKRRLQVARALISNPAVLVLDEPTTGLDPEARRILWDILKDYRTQGMAILLSTHYMEEAERLCDRIAIISKGKILDIDSPKLLITRYIKQKTIEEELRPNVVWQRPANLEDVYLKLTGSNLGANGNDHL